MFGYDEKEVVVVEKLSLNALSEVTEKLDQGKYVEADQQIEAIFIQDKIWDVRYLMYYLFSQLAQNKFDTYIEFSEHVNSLFTDNYALLSPIHRKEKVVQKAIDWFEKYFPEKFEAVMDIFPNEQELESVCYSTIRLIDAMAEKSYIVESLQQKLNKLTQSFSVKTNSNTSNIESEEEQEITSNDGNNLQIKDEQTDLPPSTSTLSAQQEKNEQEVQNASVEWARLLTLLEDYRYYTENGHSEIAYLAHLKIEKALSNFNPVTYFPKVFEGYLRSKIHNYTNLYNFKRQQIEEQPYAHMVSEILENNDPHLRKMLSEKPFEYIEEHSSAAEEYVDEDI